MNIALFLPNWIGDAVMATPAVRALREHFHGAHLIGVVRPYIAAVLEGSPWLDELVFLDTKGRWSQRWPAVAAQLRRRAIDLAVLFPNSFRSALVAWAGQCRRRAGYVRIDRSWLLTESLEPVCDAGGRRRPSPAILAYNRLAEAVGCPTPSCRMELFTTSRDEAAANTVWQRAGLDSHREVVCLNPGAAFGSAKYWPAEYFAVLARQLADRRSSGVLVLCGPAESKLAHSIVTQARHPAVHSLVDYALSIGLSKACVRRADLLITTDSGPRHIAAAFDRPVVTLFGPTHIAWTETYHPKAIHLQKVVDCGPCQRRVCPLDHRCMKLLTPDEVFSAAAELLARYPRLPAAYPAGEPDAPARTLLARRVAFSRGLRIMAFLKINPRYRQLLEQQGLVAPADFLNMPSVIICGHPDRHVARVTLGTGPGAVPAYLKREHRVPWKDRLLNAIAGFGFVSKSSREASILSCLLRAGVRCPDWIAVGEDRKGRAFLLLRKLTGYQGSAVVFGGLPTRINRRPPPLCTPAG